MWPDGAQRPSSRIHSGLTAIAVVGLVAAFLLLAIRDDPLLLVPIAAATALLAARSGRARVRSETLDDLSARQAVAFVLPLGLAWITAGLWLDVTQAPDFATWAHWAGLVPHELSRSS